MQTLISIRNFIQKYFPFVVIAVSVVAFLMPGPFLAVKGINPYLMSFIMFGMALTMELSDFNILIKKPKITLLGITVTYVLSAGMAYIAYRLFGLPVALGVGLVMCGACPGGNITDVMTFIANGDVPLSVGLSSIATLLSPIMTPAIVYLAFNTVVNVNLWTLVQSLLTAVIIPIIVGLIIKNLFRKHMGQVEEVAPLLSFVCLLLMTGIIIALNGSAVLEMDIQIFISTLMLIILPLFSAYYISRLFNLTIWESRTVAFESGLKNTMLASMLATTAFPELADQGVGLPGVIAALLAIVVAPIIAKGWASYDKKNGVLSAKEMKEVSINPEVNISE